MVHKGTVWQYIMLLNECFNEKVNESEKYHSTPISNMLFLRHVTKHSQK